MDEHLNSLFARDIEWFGKQIHEMFRLDYRGRNTQEPISKGPISKSAFICPISASGSNFGTLVKLQRYPRNTTCIPACPVGLAARTGVVKIFAFLDLEQISADFGLKRFETGSKEKKKSRISQSGLTR